jgi:hypothetical protein
MTDPDLIRARIVSACECAVFLFFIVVVGGWWIATP